MLIFFHIPKTAGTTFHHILDKMYKNKTLTIDGIEWKTSLDYINGLSESELKKYDVIKGHMSYSLRNNPIISSKELIYLSYFRDPVKLFISTYTYIKKQPLNRYYELANSMSLSEWVDFRQSEYLDNLQSRHLLEILPHFNPLNKELDLSYYDEEELKTQLVDRLDSLNYVFTTEKFDQSLLYLKSELDWKNTPYYVSKNISVSIKGNELTSEMEFNIKKLNWLDQFLYEKVKEKEQKCLESVHEKELEKFQSINAMWKYLRYFSFMIK